MCTSDRLTPARRMHTRSLRSVIRCSNMGFSPFNSAHVAEGMTQTPIFYRLHNPNRAQQSCRLCNTDVQGYERGCRVCRKSPYNLRSTKMSTLGYESKEQLAKQTEDEDLRVLFICGMDAHHDTHFYSHLISHLVSLGCTVCAFDNRGIGRSYIPQLLSEYSTAAMCGDTLELLDTLGWERAHVVGMSMGGMIASKVAAAAPTRVASLTILNSTAAGRHMAMSLLSSPLLALRGMGFAPLAVRIRANLQCNFSPTYLASPALSGESHLEAMTRVTMEAIQRLPPSEAAESVERVGNVGHRGQLRAVMTHSLTDAEAAVVQEAAIPRQVLSGKYDPIAGQRYAQWLAEHLDCSLHVMEAAHSGITMETVGEVGAALERMILGKQRSSDAHWAAMAAEVEQRAQSTVMMRELVMSYS